jgi:hypothetical protein
LALALHTLRSVKRLFLTAPTTCALLLGAGLLMRAQAALKSGLRGSEARVSVLRHSAARPAPSEAEEGGNALPVGEGRRALARRATDGERREQPRSHRGNAGTQRARAAGRQKRKARGRKVVMPDWGRAGGAGEGGRQ